MSQPTHAERTLVGRRSVLTGGAAAVLAAAGFRAGPAWADGVGADRPADGSHRLTVMGTTDLHGNVFNWDYFNERGVRRHRPQRHRPGQGLHPGQRGARRSAAGPTPC